MLDPVILEDFLVFGGLMSLLGAVTKVTLALISRRKDRGLSGDDVTNRLDEISQRLGRLEQAVDATATEVERISEGQRFTTKLLAERKPLSS